MDIEEGMSQNGTLKPEATPKLLLQNHSSTVETLINIHIFMFILQAIISAYETEHTAEKLFWDSLPWLILTLFTIFCKKMYRIYKNKRTFEMLELYRRNKDYIQVAILCYTGMLFFTVILGSDAYVNRDDPIKSGRTWFSLVCMLSFLWCVKELYHEEEEKRRKRLIIISSTAVASRFANVVFGICYLHSSSLEVGGVAATPFFVVVWIIAYHLHHLSEQDQDRASHKESWINCVEWLG